MSSGDYDRAEPGSTGVSEAPRAASNTIGPVNETSAICCGALSLRRPTPVGGPPRSARALACRIERDRQGTGRIGRGRTDVDAAGRFAGRLPDGRPDRAVEQLDHDEAPEQHGRCAPGRAKQPSIPDRAQPSPTNAPDRHAQRAGVESAEAGSDRDRSDSARWADTSDTSGPRPVRAFRPSPQTDERPETVAPGRQRTRQPTRAR